MRRPSGLFVALLVGALALAACDRAEVPPASPAVPVTTEPGDARDAALRDAGVVRPDQARDAAPATVVTTALVDVATKIPDAVLDIRYATARNFVGHVLYSQARCLLRPPAAERLQAVADKLRKRGFRLRIWDCYRPFSVQEQLWSKVADPRYVGKPERKNGAPFKGSRHNRGAAVDLSLVTLDGRDVPMPTDYDDFSAKAHRSELSRNGRAFENARVLESAMTEAGFVGLKTEWWHYDLRGWQEFQLLDVPFDEL